MGYRFSTLIGCLLSLLSIGIVVAQSTCPMIVEDALEALGDNCEALPRNNACYGYNRVFADFAIEVEDDFFVEPADIAELEIVESIQPTAMDINLEQWGIAVMNLQANIPNSIPGQAVKFLLIGDTTVEGDVEPEIASKPIDAIEVTATGSFNVIDLPTDDGIVRAQIADGDTLSVDGRNADGSFYRVAGEDYVGWVPAEAVADDEGLADLPIMDEEQRGLMQAFYLRSGIGLPLCDEAPQDTLIIQSPENITVDLTVNGAKIRLHSTIAARILSPADVLEFTVLEGELIILGAGPNGDDLIVPEDHQAFACLGDPINDGLDGRENDQPIGCDWSTPAPMSDGIADFCALENIPASVLNYPLELSCDEPVTTTTTTTTTSNQNSSTTITEPVVPQATPTRVPTVIDPQDSDLGAYNLCYEGNAWGDGRCTTPVDWQAGFYYGLYEADLIALSDIPEPYYIEPTPIAGESGGSDGRNPIVYSFSCGPLAHEYTINVSQGATGDTSFLIDWVESTSGLSDGVGPTGFGPVTFSVVPPEFPNNVKIVTQPSDTGRRLGNLNCP